MSNWGIRLSKAAWGVTTPLFYLWRVNGVNLPGHGLPCVGWMAGLLPGSKRGKKWERLRELPTEAPMNRQRVRREGRAGSTAMTARYKLPRTERRKIAKKIAKGAIKKATKKQ